MNHIEAMKRVAQLVKEGHIGKALSAIDAAIKAAEKQEPVVAGSLSVWYYRGSKAMTNTDFDYFGDLPEGDYILYTTPPAQPAPVQEPVALQMEVIVVNLVREGINKHRARELAEHFIKHTTPPAAPVQESKRCGLCGEDQPFTGTCGGGRENSKALCYTHAAQRQWVELTDEEALTEAARHLGEMHVENCGFSDIKDFARAIKAKLREKNGYDK